MIYIIILSTFFCAALAAMSACMVAFRRTSAINARLDSMDPSLAFGEGSQAQAIAERFAGSINRFIPISASESNKLRKRLFYAGYRSPDAPSIFRAIQLVMMAFLSSMVFLSSVYFNLSLINSLIWAFIAASLGFYLPRFFLQRQITARQMRVTRGLADALDLLLITIEAGLGLNAALVRVGEELKNVHREIYEEFETVNLEIRVGRGREEALRNLAERTGVDDLRSFVALMIQADRFGSSIGQAVRVFAESLRTKRRQRAEQAAQKAALKLLFPLTFFLFPTIIMVILGPSILNLIDLLGG